MRRLFYLFLFSSVLILSGCGPATVNKALKTDQSVLDSQQIFNVVANNSLILSAYDFSGTVYFASNGLLSAVDNRNQKDIGKWDVNTDNQLCMKFRIWYYGDAKCYQIFNNEQAEKFTFFTSNGAAYYTAMMVKGDPADLARHIDSKSSSQSVRKQLADNLPEDTTGTSQTTPVKNREIAITESQTNDSVQTVKRLAGNCPGCKMAGIDLKEASLIKANLQGADLSGADLRYANLRRANLKGANLRGARLTHANLPGADLSGAILINCDLTGANLLLANLTDADTTGALFTNANLERTIGLKKQ